MKLVAALIGVLFVASAFVAQLLRWSRVLQREHYEPASMSRFLGRWSSPPVAGAAVSGRRATKRPLTLTHVLFLALVIAVMVRSAWAVIVVSVLYGWLCPQGLSIKGRTSPLQWTRRLTTTVGVTTTLAIAIAVVGAFTPQPWLAAAVVVWAVPLFLDLSARILQPFERRRASVFVQQATRRLSKVNPRIVAITGSYGKTSTKNHLADLLSARGDVVASPRSFNNRAGLSRAVNENLADGTRVFIAEMGTYGPGEIRDLCEWCVPDIAVVTAIGPVHLERMKSLDVIESAKFEITERAPVIVVNIDDPRLATWVPRLRESGKSVRTAASVAEDASIQVRVDGDQWTLKMDGVELFVMAPISGVQPTNLACAIAAALEIGTAPSDIIPYVQRVQAVANRSTVAIAPSGVTVIDDTFNANPASATSALNVLMAQPLTGRRVVVTPGLIELGRDQYPENLRLGQKIAAYGAELAIVGRTNVQALSAGFGPSSRRFDSRDDAVAWVRGELTVGDGVLYLNDLPDHYP